jgi:3'-phosphoadenosine 5'-phosphosulfate sulfotransferase (PAPS reductase)/FAD synthetase
MSCTKHIASCSGGKDSVATLLLAAEHNEPLDEAVFSEVMFDRETSGEVPEHRDFIYNRLKPFCENELGIKFTILHADKTYDDVFHHIIVRAHPIKERSVDLCGRECAQQTGIAKYLRYANTMPCFPLQL